MNSVLESVRISVVSQVLDTCGLSVDDVDDKDLEFGSTEAGFPPKLLLAEGF